MRGRPGLLRGRPALAKLLNDRFGGRGIVGRDFFVRFESYGVTYILSLRSTFLPLQNYKVG